MVIWDLSFQDYSQAVKQTGELFQIDSDEAGAMEEEVLVGSESIADDWLSDPVYSPQEYEYNKLMRIRLGLIQIAGVHMDCRCIQLS